MRGGRRYHAGGDTTGACADHDIGDLGAPEFLALGGRHDGQGSLLQLVGSLEGYRDRGCVVRVPGPTSLLHTTMGPFSMSGALLSGSTTGRAWASSRTVALVLCGRGYGLCKASQEHGPHRAGVLETHDRAYNLVSERRILLSRGLPSGLIISRPLCLCWMSFKYKVLTDT